jgi:CRP-like cAMP-binding protein
MPDSGDALTGVEMFAGLEPDVRQRVIATAVPRTYRKGQIIFVEHDPGESLIILKRGAVAIFRTAPTGERAVLTVVRPPDVLGEVSLLDAATRSASARRSRTVRRSRCPGPRSSTWCTPTRASWTRSCARSAR